MENDVIIKLKGGMGNQMFQYAFALALKNSAAKSSVPINILFDTSAYAQTNGKDTFRKLLITHLHTEVREATPAQVEAARNPFGIISKVLRKFNHMLHGEFDVDFTPSILLPPYKKYYEGYWQSEKYFSEIRGLVREAFKLKTPLGKAGEQIVSMIEEDQHATSIFYRRTDYVGHPDLDIGEQDYQRRAIQRMFAIDPSTRLYVMSDHIEWAKQSAELPANTVFVSSPEIPDYEEITIASKCRNNIIPNSTFAWWGAWLNENPEKHVIMPKLWSIAHNDDWYKDIAPEDWIRV